MSYRPEFIAALGLIAEAFDLVKAAGYARPVLVGGAAVEFYTVSAIVSGDFDIVSGATTPLEDALIAVGFIREDRQGRLLRSFYHPVMLIGVEIVSGQLFDGRADRDRMIIVKIDGHEVQLPAPEDMIADRLGQYASNPRGRSDMLNQAVTLYVLAEDIDEAYLDRRLHEETGGDYDLEFLKAKADERPDDHP